MTNNIYQRVAVAVSGVALSWLAVEASAQAATLTYDFTVSTSFTTVFGSQFKGWFSYDDSNQTNSGLENFGEKDGLNIEFTFPGEIDFSGLSGTPGVPLIADRLVTYTESDSEIGKQPSIAFFNGKFLGLLFLVDVCKGDPFSFSCKSSDPNPYFSFVIHSDMFGLTRPDGLTYGGDVTYTKREEPTQSVPEPGTALGFSIFGLATLLAKKKLTWQRDKIAYKRYGSG